MVDAALHAKLASATIQRVEATVILARQHDVEAVASEQCQRLKQPLVVLMRPEVRWIQSEAGR